MTKRKPLPEIVRCRKCGEPAGSHRGPCVYRTLHDEYPRTHYTVVCQCAYNIGPVRLTERGAIRGWGIMQEAKP